MRNFPALLCSLLALAACTSSTSTSTSTSTSHASSNATPAVSADSTASANGSESTATIGGIALTARTLPMRNISAVMAKRYGLAPDPDALLLLVTLRDAQGDAVAVDGLQVDARAARLPDAPQPLALERIEVDGMVDLVGSYKTRPPATVRFELDARRGGARSQIAFTRDLLPQ